MSHPHSGAIKKRAGFPACPFLTKSGKDARHTNTSRILHLHEAPYLTWKKVTALYKADPALSLPYQLSPSELSKQLRLSAEQAGTLYHYLHTPENKMAAYQARHIHILTPFMNEYPPRLHHIYDPPWVLYARGNLELLQTPSSLAVVGTRKLTAYGRNAMNQFLSPVIRQNRTIISGLAIGTDTLAHKITVREKGTTIAVLGSGFDCIYPRENTGLAEHLSTHHLLLSEYPPSTPPRKWQFPMRNRIISGLADAVFISEAAERSGSLITAYQALEQGKDVKALPGPVFSPMSKGTNQLIKEGAAPVTSFEDL
ncbi:DNA-processing protein DprA [Salibacterium aidingense]|uniref:DNA-processing protein DprA n=1 Tax=Salibacterium aidingense TaxID=384933 RepID=UPI000403990B|nr:DNA-processing protein DprA [Salibacterium aidingense]